MLQREIQVNFRVDTSEYFSLLRRARQAGVSRAEYIRSRCFEDKKFVIQDGQAIRDCYKEINSLGKDIHQIAHIALRSGENDPKMLAEVLELMRQVKRKTDEKLGGM